MNLTYQKIKIEAGLDEAGRGCLAGPVVAAAVILDANFDWSALNDSKKLTESKRMVLREQILDFAVAYGVGVVSHKEIDELNILNASFLAMHRAIDAMAIEPDFLAIDGNRFTPYKQIPFACVVKGDSKLRNIAAASILAKTGRDAIMLNLHKQHPYYAWDKNKGYPTKTHRQAIHEFGVSKHHRLTFRLLPCNLGKED